MNQSTLSKLILLHFARDSHVCWKTKFICDNTARFPEGWSTTEGQMSSTNSYKPQISHCFCLTTGCSIHTWPSERSHRRKTDLSLKALPRPDIKEHLKSGHCLICHSDECLTWTRPSVKHKTPLSSKWALTVSFYLILFHSVVSVPLCQVQLHSSYRDPYASTHWYQGKNVKMQLLVKEIYRILKINMIFSKVDCTATNEFPWKKVQIVFRSRVSESPTVALGQRGLPLVPLPLRGAQREVITLSPNRKPHQRGIVFLHKPVKEGAAKWTGTRSRASLMNSEAQKTIILAHARPGGNSVLVSDLCRRGTHRCTRTDLTEIWRRLQR